MVSGRISRSPQGPQRSCLNFSLKKKTLHTSGVAGTPAPPTCSYRNHPEAGSPGWTCSGAGHRPQVLREPAGARGAVPARFTVPGRSRGGCARRPPALGARARPARSLPGPEAGARSLPSGRPAGWDGTAPQGRADGGREEPAAATRPRESRGPRLPSAPSRQRGSVPPSAREPRGGRASRARSPRGPGRGPGTRAPSLAWRPLWRAPGSLQPLRAGPVSWKKVTSLYCSVSPPQELPQTSRTSLRGPQAPSPKISSGFSPEREVTMRRPRIQFPLAA